MPEIRKRKSRKRSRTPISGLEKHLQTIINRLGVLEDDSRRYNSDIGASTSRALPALAPNVPAPPAPSETTGLPLPLSAASCGTSLDMSVLCSGTMQTSTDLAVSQVTDKIVSALDAMPVRSNHVFISSFDPSLHDFDSWCSEVDHARLLNKWDDRECLVRIGNCLKGDARLWLYEWVSNDRSWSNFKREFKSLCPVRVDIANILFNVMSTDYNNYPTYAEYARRSLLRLRIVNGLSDELMVVIIIRGITDPHIRAAATNANLALENVVNFLSIYVKPAPSAQTTPVRK